MATEDNPRAKIALIMELRQLGVRDRKVLNVMERMPRDRFVLPAFEAQAYANQALPIACGQTISQPFIVAYMTQELKLDERMKVLEIGTGSGYQAAVLSQLCRRVYTVERYRSLLKEAEKRFQELRITNITARAGDGLWGWPEQAPFDRILITAAAPEIPDKLVRQLKPGGIMILPLELPDARAGDAQQLVRLIRTEDGYEREDLLAVRFVPLLPGIATEG